MYSILNTEVSQFKNYYDAVPIKTVNLLQWLQDDSHMQKVDRIRHLDDKVAMDRIKATLPCITASGTFSTRSKAGLIQHSGLICIDIDYKENQHVENYSELKRILSTAPFVAYCGLSVSGTGYFVIIPIKYPEKHEMQFEALYQMFKKLGIVIDISCKDVSRLRGYSWDSDPYINHGAIPFDKVYEEPQSIKPAYELTRNKTTPGKNTKAQVEKYINAIRSKAVDITDNYKNWLQVGFALANEFGEAGRLYFHEVSRCYPKYKYADADKKYTGLLKSNTGRVSIGTFFHLCKSHGIAESTT